MRVLEIGDDWPTERAGGLNSYFSELVRHLTLAGVDARGLVVGTSDVSESSNGTVKAFARSDDSLTSRFFAVRRATQHLLARTPTDLLAVHFALYGFPILDTLRKLPSVIHFHGPWAAESGVEGAHDRTAWAKTQLERAVYSAADLAIVLSDAFKRELINRYGMAEHRIRIIPGGVDTARFNIDISRTAARTKLGWSQEAPIILCVRRQVRRMGLENLIDAAKELKAHGQDFVLYLGGTGPLANELKNRIARLNLENEVRLVGRISDFDLPLAYRAADLSVVPTQALEGFGLIAVESLSAGTPVYVTPIGGLPEVVQPFAPQCVFTDSSVGAIVTGIMAALRKEHMVPSEASCRAYAVEQFSWNRIASLVQDVYQEAIT